MGRSIGATDPGSSVLIAAEGVSKTYRLGRVRVPVLRGADLSVREGEWVAILGASGSGKSTLLHLLGGLDRPDRAGGRIVFRGGELGRGGSGELNRYRNLNVGFVFQFYHLLPELTVIENTLLPAMIAQGRLGYLRKGRELRARARELLDSFGLGARLRHRPGELSGGERQRVAIARALLNEPTLLLADEPTGNLDRSTGSKILDSIATMHAKRAGTMVMVTHDPEVAARAGRIVHLIDGRVA